MAEKTKFAVIRACFITITGAIMPARADDGRDGTMVRMAMARLGFAVWMAALVLMLGAVTPAPAASTQDFSAKSRPHITVHPRRVEPGPHAKRYCRSWLQKQYRVSGTVIVPQMRCWWD